jgi:OTU-like cysteine protease.
MGKRKDKKSIKKKSKKHEDYAPPKGKGKRGKGKTKTSKNWDKYFNEFQEKLKAKGIYMRDVDGDGNCLFRSIADQLEGDEENHAKYREMAVEYIKKNKEHFAPFISEDEDIEKYIQDMSEDGTWGGHFELVALSAVLGVKFCLHLKDEEPVIVKSHEQKKFSKIVHLAYHIDEHYSSVRKIGDNDKAPAEEIPLQVLDKVDNASEDTESDSDSNDEDSTDSDMEGVTKNMNRMSLNDSKNKSKKKQDTDSDEEEEKSNAKNKKFNKGKDKHKEKADNNKKTGKGKKGRV